MTNTRCSDCGCRVCDHNAVNRISGERLIAHCGHCGACWKTKDHPDFVAAVRTHILENGGIDHDAAARAKEQSK